MIGWRLLSAFLLITGLAACQFGGVQVERTGEGSARITVDISESEANQLIGEIVARANPPLLINPQLDLQNGQMVLNGEYDRRDGQRMRGSITLVPSVANSAIQITANAVNIDGFEATDARLADLNARLAEGLGARGRERGSGVRFESVTVSDTQLRLVFTVGGN